MVKGPQPEILYLRMVGGPQPEVPQGGNLTQDGRETAGEVLILEVPQERGSQAEVPQDGGPQAEVQQGGGDLRTLLSMWQMSMREVDRLKSPKI